MQTHLFSAWYKQNKEQAFLHNERRLVVLSGEELWAKSIVESVEPTWFMEATDLQQGIHSTLNILIYGDSQTFDTNVQLKRYRDKLGSECDGIVFADSQFNIDAFAALSGTLKAGGIFIFVVNDIESACKKSLFSQRFFSLIEQMKSHTIIKQSQRDNLVNISDTPVQLPEIKTEKLNPIGCINEEQYSAVKAIEKVLTGHRKRPLVLTADRGRGKSSALAIACAQMLQANQHKDFSLVITAPDIQSLSVFFKQLKHCLSEAEASAPIKNSPQSSHRICVGLANITYLPVDQLLKQSLKVNMVLVDEAAAIPVYLLERLVSHYHRMVFSSTIHGYEGAGRGFTLKFQQTLNKQCPQWQGLHINQPIRWRDQDPLETLVFDACLLNAELPAISLPSVEGISSNKINHELSEYKQVSGADLLANEALLSQVFAILVTAHYQTKPSDLVMMLDNDKVQIACLFSKYSGNSEVIAVALLMQEGKSSEITKDDITAVKNSQKRIRNNFIPQSLLSHCGLEDAFEYRYLRIMRIAVTPQLQHQGVGAYFVNKIAVQAKMQGLDYIGTSFGANVSLLSFWFHSGLAPVRIGFTKDKASGEHSALLLKSLSSQATHLQHQLVQSFHRSFDYLLQEEYQNLAAELVLLLSMQNTVENLDVLTPQDIANVNAFVLGERLFSSCAYSLYLWFKHELVNENRFTKDPMDQGALVLTARLLQKRTIEDVCSTFNLTGKKALNKNLQAYVTERLKSLIKQ